MSQRPALNDPMDLKPPVHALGNHADITKLFHGSDYVGKLPPGFLDVVLEKILGSTDLQEKMLKTALNELKIPDQVGILCMTDRCDSKHMWQNYAEKGTGFVLGFRTNLLLSMDGVLGRVSYENHPIANFLSEYGLNTLFRKTTEWQYEEEWRYLKLLNRCILDGKDLGGLPLHFLRYSPDALFEIVVRSECAVAQEMLLFLSTDSRYRHIRLRMLVAATTDSPGASDPEA